jgi:predicted nucleic acid-binding Zn ribbon protein
MKCPKCGKEIANDSVFCEYCGEQIKKNNRVKNPWRLIAFLFMAVVAVGAVYVLVHQFGNDTDDLRQDSFYLTGTAAGTPCTIQFDFLTRQGRYTQDLGSGRQTVRDLRLSSYAADILILDAYDTKGRRVSQFSGTLDPQLNSYSGTITNNQGGAINFHVSR